MSLAVGPASLRYPKLPFWETVSISYSTYFHNFVEVLRTSWLWLAAAAALTALASRQQWSWMANFMANAKSGTLPHLVPRPFELIVLGNFANLLMLFAGVSIAVAWHRLMILGEHPGFSGDNVLTKNLWRYIGIGIAICLAVIVPAAAIVVPLTYLFPFKSAGGFSPVEFFILFPVLVVLYAVGMSVILRLSLLLPAQAVGDLSLTFKQTWDRTRGNTWRIFWGLGACTIPATIVAQIVFVMGMGSPNPELFGSESFVMRMTFFSTAFVVYYLLILPISIGFLSHAYRHFFREVIEPRR
jgi:hypothetical protein